MIPLGSTAISFCTVGTNPYLFDRPSAMGVGGGTCRVANAVRSWVAVWRWNTILKNHVRAHVVSSRSASISNSNWSAA